MSIREVVFYLETYNKLLNIKTVYLNKSTNSERFLIVVI